MTIVNSLTGSIIAAKYELAELLGEGGSGSTYRAIRLSDRMEVAIKILSLRHLNDWKQLELFEREAKVLSQLSHPQIPKYLEYFHVDTPSNRAFYIVQQLAPGKPLAAWVQSGWCSTEKEVRDIASQLLTILQYLHEQSPPLIHRDIKPHNIIRNDDGQVFLVDFGAVQDVYHNTLMKGSTVAGTYGYMAPEQFRGAAVPASDLYGLGATVLYLLTHRSPADLPQERLKLSFRGHVNIANYFADWLEMLLEPNTTDRFPSATAALLALQKKHRFRVQRGSKIGFPWKGAVAAVGITVFAAPLFHQYRYAFLTIIGLQPRDLCTIVQNHDTMLLNDYLNHGGSANVSVVVDDDSLLTQGYEANSASLLHCAVKYGQADIVDDLLQRGAEPSARTSSGSTPLHRIVSEYHSYSKNDQSDRHQQILHSLIDYKADLEAKDQNNESPLLLAVKIQSPVLVKDLIKFGANPNTVNANKSSLWHVLAWHSSPKKNNNSEEFLNSLEIANITEIAQQLIAANVDINKPNSSGDTPLHTAVQSKNQVLISLLLESNAISDLKNKQGQTPLTTAVIDKDISMIQVLLSQAVGVNVPNADGKTPLMLAIENANSTSPSVDISKDVLEGNHKNTQAIISLLLKMGANPNLVDQAGNTASHLLGYLKVSDSNCIQRSPLSVKLLDLLVQYRADPLAANHEGDTALHIAARQEFFPLMKRMIGYGWNPLQNNRTGESALSISSEHFGLPISNMQILLNPSLRSILINQQDQEGNTLLHQAILGKIGREKSSSTSRLKLIRLLANAGANFDIENKAGETAANIAPQLETADLGKPSNFNQLPATESVEILRSVDNMLQELVWQCKSEYSEIGDK
jgi:serine/threonine protein kinase